MTGTLSITDHALEIATAAINDLKEPDKATTAMKNAALKRALEVIQKPDSTWTQAKVAAYGAALAAK